MIRPQRQRDPWEGNPWEDAQDSRFEQIVTIDAAVSSVLLSPIFPLQEALESRFPAIVRIRNNEVTINAETATIQAITAILGRLQHLIKATGELSVKDFDAALCALPDSSEGFAIRHHRVAVRNQAQSRYLDLLRNKPLVFAIGPAGTGKTHMAVAYGLSQLLSGRVSKLVLARPAIEAGERLGFLPGDMRDKIDPYFRPIYDTIDQYIDRNQFEKYLSQKQIEIAPLAFMRGRTLERTYAVLDEGQNATRGQMKMFLTRFGHHSRMVITGDPQQSDLVNLADSGLAYAAQALRAIKSIGQITFVNADVVRHPLVQEILSAWPTP